MSSSKGTSKDVNLLQLFDSGQLDRRVVTRSDLTSTDYPGNDADDNDDSPRPSNSSNSGGAVAINNHYTWNSPKTISSIHKERAEIISALHSVKSTSELLRGLKTCDGFARSHRMREIMSMCADRRCDFSADEYHRQDHGNSGNERGVAAVTEPDDDDENVATVWQPTGSETSPRRSWSSSYVGGTSRCWSCTATDPETDYDNVDEAHNRRRKSDNQRTRKFRKSR